MTSPRAITVVLALLLIAAGAGTLAGGDDADAARKRAGHGQAGAKAIAARQRAVKSRAGKAHIPARMLLPTRTWPRPQAGGDAPPGGGPTTTESPGSPAQPPRECPAALGVEEDDTPEWFVRTTRAEVCAGSTVTVEARNLGEDDHDLRIVRIPEAGGFQPVSFPVMAPNARETRTITFPAGRFYLYCTLVDGGGSHEARGMSAQIDAT